MFHFYFIYLFFFFLFTFSPIEFQLPEWKGYVALFSASVFNIVFSIFSTGEFHKIAFIMVFGLVTELENLIRIVWYDVGTSKYIYVHIYAY